LQVKCSAKNELEARPSVLYTNSTPTQHLI
jgi:hypothetical protein